MVKPIKRSLLIHTVEYAEKGGDSMWGGGEHKTPLTVKHVRVEPKSKFVRSSDGESIESDTVLFWDAIFSTPAEWKQDSKVTFNGREMTVTGIDEFYDSNRLHHVEVQLA